VLPAFAITGQTYWVDDPNSVYYNQRVEGTQNRDWRSAEHMIRHEELYGLGFVIGYNTRDIVPGAGSAIFFHRGDDYTAGCVAAEGADLLGLLAALETDAHILID
jgi:L,D-peptidoglycan transpeptidase YkuD (ErfK/YbiS/YcfS/YnhG family)